MLFSFLKENDQFHETNVHLHNNNPFKWLLQLTNIRDEKTHEM